MIRAFFALFVIVIGLSGCTNPPHRQQFPELTYGYLPPFKLNVAILNVVDSYPSSESQGHIEKSFPQIPAEIMRRWATDRLKAVGQNGSATFTILRADAISVPLPRTSGIQGTFTTDQAERYDLTLEAKLDVNAPGQASGTINARSFVSQTIAENATLNEREAIMFQMVEKGMKALNTELERQINGNLRPFLLP